MDPLHNLEQSRLQLEQQMEEIEKKLDYWRNWETDYEILKEDIVAARPKTHELLAAVAGEFKGKTLNEQEIQKLLVSPAGAKRSTKEVVDVLKHRLEYVKGNVDSLSKQKALLSEQLDDEGDVLPLDMADQEGLPLTEIVEELDDDGNVISRSTSTPNEDLTRQLEQRLGSQKLAAKTLSPTEPSGTISQSTHFSDTKTQLGSESAQARAKARAEELAASLENENETEAEGEEKLSAEVATAQLLDSIATVTDSGDSALGPVLERKQPEANAGTVKILSSRPKAHLEAVLPNDESPEDAAMRREMLEYSLNEVGAVVAEMNLEADSDEDEEMYEHLDYDDVSEESEEEDEWGRTIDPKIPDSYRKEMMELEKQLHAGRIQNLGPAPGRISPDLESDEEDQENTISEIPQKRHQPDAVPSKGALKKVNVGGNKPRGVRFADNVDVSEPPSKREEIPRELANAKVPLPATIANQVMERSSGTSNAIVSDATPSRKQSRFKASRAAVAEKPPGYQRVNVPATTARAESFAGPLLDASSSRPRERQDTPSGPAGLTHADIVERGSEAAVQAPGEDEDDPDIQRRGIAAEYYEKRNAMIQAQGGFTAQDSATVRVDDEGNEIKPKVSRFKAARLGKER